MALFKSKKAVVAEIALGSRIRDILSGVEGMAMSRTDCLNGNVRYALQPKSENGVSLPDAFDFDYHNLEVIDPGVSHRAVTPPEVNIRLGDRVRDIVSGYEGIATAKLTHLNGCVYFSVVPPKSEKAMFTEAPGGSSMPHERLRVCKTGGLADEFSKAPATERPTGGPTTKVARRAASRW